jgi:hypothetical protein
MKLKFKALPGLQAWVIRNQTTDYLPLFSLAHSLMDPDVYYGGDGYPTEHTPSPAGWYSVWFMDGTEDSVDMYLTDPENYSEYLADCGIGTMMRGPCE